MTDYDQEREPRDYRYENSLPPRQRRRQFLHSMGALLVTVPFVPVMLGCAKTTPSTGSSAADLGSGDAGAVVAGLLPQPVPLRVGTHQEPRRRTPVAAQNGHGCRRDSLRA